MQPVLTLPLAASAACFCSAACRLSSAADVAGVLLEGNMLKAVSAKECRLLEKLAKTHKYKKGDGKIKAVSIFYIRLSNMVLRPQADRNTSSLNHSCFGTQFLGTLISSPVEIGVVVSSKNPVSNI